MELQLTTGYCIPSLLYLTLLYNGGPSQDRGSGGMPDKGVWLFVVFTNVVLNGTHQFRNTAKRLLCQTIRLLVVSDTDLHRELRRRQAKTDGAPRRLRTVPHHSIDHPPSESETGHSSSLTQSVLQNS
jgi:hypothetical protein